jgi:hypothetical protein
MKILPHYCTVLAPMKTRITRHVEFGFVSLLCGGPTYMFKWSKWLRCWRMKPLWCDATISYLSTAVRRASFIDCFQRQCRTYARKSTLLPYGTLFCILKSIGCLIVMEIHASLFPTHASVLLLILWAAPTSSGTPSLSHVMYVFSVGNILPLIM